MIQVNDYDLLLNPSEHWGLLNKNLALVEGFFALYLEELFNKLISLNYLIILKNSLELK